MLLWRLSSIALKPIPHNIDKSTLLSHKQFDVECNNDYNHCWFHPYIDLDEPILKNLILKSGLSMITNKLRSQRILMIMLYDFLFGRQCIVGGGSLHRSIKEYAPRIYKLLDQERSNHNIRSNTDLLPVLNRERTNLPRYARVNTLLTCLDLIISDDLEFTIDDHIPNLIIISPSISIHNHKLVISSYLILQDKASCFPAHILLNTKYKFRHIIDACAAPGYYHHHRTH